MNGADLIAQILKLEGVEFIPAFPHSDLIDSGTRAGIRPLIVRQERHALHMADGYTRMMGGRKICCSTVQFGPGSENSFGAVAQCYADNVPVLHISGGYPRSEQGSAPNFTAVRNMQHINKWCEMILQSDRIPQMMQSAFAQLRNGRPGPVTLEVPADIYSEKVDPALLDKYRLQYRSAPVANSIDVSKFVTMLLDAKSPVIIAGQGILYGEACEELLLLANLTKTPVISTLNGKSCFPENHELSLGCAGGGRPDTVNYFLEKADVILGLGTSFTRSDYITPFPTEGRIFAQLTNYDGDLSKDYPVDLGVVGDAKASIAAMIEEIKDRHGKHNKGFDHWWNSWGKDRNEKSGVIKEIADHRAAFMKKWMPLLSSDEKPINPYRVIWDLMNTVDRTKTVVTHDAGSPRDQITPFYESIIPHGYMGWGKTTQLGMGLGLMHGAKLAKPDWNCINFMGDAAIGMVGMDFETGVRCKLGVLTIVLKNSVMGGYADYHPDGTKTFGINQLGGNYADLAKALGGYGERVESPAEIVPAIERALNQTKEGVPALLEFITTEETRIPRDLPKGI